MNRAYPTAPSAGWFSMRIGGASGVAEPWHRTFEAINTRLLSPNNALGAA